MKPTTTLFKLVSLKTDHRELKTDNHSAKREKPPKTCDVKRKSVRHDGLSSTEWCGLSFVWFGLVMVKWGDFQRVARGAETTNTSETTQ